MDYTQAPVGFRLGAVRERAGHHQPHRPRLGRTGAALGRGDGRLPERDDRRPQVGNDTIKILEDTDGDGKCDKVTVFADGLNIPTSLTFSRGGIIVAHVHQTSCS